MLDDTLIVWGGEFGRTPMAQGNGRDHHIKGFSMWLAGGGIKGGITYGATDELGYDAVENAVHVHDLHATMLHLLGIDHTRLTYRFQGRDFRLTDVAGNVVRPILADVIGTADCERLVLRRRLAESSASMSKVRWGILSTAKIGVGQSHSRHAAGDALPRSWPSPRAMLTRAQAAAERLGIPTAHGSYEALLADPEVDAIYNPLPNHLHVPLVDRGARGRQARAVRKADRTVGRRGPDSWSTRPGGIRKLKVMEAFMYRHHPAVAAGQADRARRRHRRVAHDSDRSFPTTTSTPRISATRPTSAAADWPTSAATAISLSRFIFDAEPRRVMGIVEYDPSFGIDRLASAILDFGGGTSTFTCGTQLAPYQRVNIFGTEGRVEIDIPFNAPPDRPCTMRHQQHGRIEEIALAVCDQYTIQGDLFAAAVLDDTPVPTPIEDARGQHAGDRSRGRQRQVCELDIGRRCAGRPLICIDRQQSGASRDKETRRARRPTAGPCDRRVR